MLKTFFAVLTPKSVDVFPRVAIETCMYLPQAFQLTGILHTHWPRILSWVKLQNIRTTKHNEPRSVLPLHVKLSVGYTTTIIHHYFHTIDVLHPILPWADGQLGEPIPELLDIDVLKCCGIPPENLQDKVRWSLMWYTNIHIKCARLPYLNQSCNIVNWTSRYKLQWNLNQNAYIFIQENAFEKIVCKMALILSRLQCIKTWSYTTGYWTQKSSG